MRALGLDFDARRPDEFDIPEPGPPRAGEVLLRIREVGVCATDRELSRFHYGEPPPGETRLVLGHEALGEVLETGSRVAGVGKGDWVVPMIRRSCKPACAACRVRRRDLCLTDAYTERGISRAHGYLAPYAVDKAEDLVAVPSALADRAVLLEPLSVVEKAIETGLRAHPLKPRQAVVFGAGPVGMLCALALLERGIETQVTSLEPSDHPRARLLRRAGASYSTGRPAARADLVFEASGAAEAAREAMEILAPPGVLVLIGAADAELPLALMRTVLHNLTVTGVVNAGPAHFEMAVKDLARIPARLLKPLIERRRSGLWRESLNASPDKPKIVLEPPR